MIPYGMNPHGLEERTLTFCVLENNNPAYTFYSQNRLYCWAEFPQELIDCLSSNYGISATDVALSTTIASDESGWNALPKYKSKQVSGNHFMVHGNQTFYYQTWRVSTVPDFATIYVLDTSGTMSDNKNDVKQGITGEIYDYNNYEYPMKDSKMEKDSKIWVYSAAKLSDMTVQQSVLGQLRFGEATSIQIWNAVDPFITEAMKKTAGSESMATNMYFAIADFITKIFTGPNAEPIGIGCKLSAATFFMLTDENIFSYDTLDYYEKLTTPGNQFYREWFQRWQTDATNKFPTVRPSISSSQDTKAEFCIGITKALWQMSYYYGVNFVWALYGGICISNNKTTVVDKNTAAFFCDCIVDTTKIVDGEYPVTYKYNGKAIDDPWIVPDTFPIDYPHRSMLTIQFTVPPEYIVGGQDAFKDGITMRYDDQFTWRSIMEHFHRQSGNTYCAFRYVPISGHTYSETPIHLPSVGNMNIDSGTYHWVINLESEDEISFACDSYYSVNISHIEFKPETNTHLISFSLVKDS